MLVISVAAITGSIGNARMVLKAKTGDTVERTILVRNVNNVSVNVEMITGGDLMKDITIKNANFTLSAGEEIKVPFSIKIREVNTSESKINVKFLDPSGKGGVVLTSTIIVIAEKGSLFGWGDDKNPNEESIGFNKMWIAGIMTGLLIIVLIVLMIISKRKNKTKFEIKQDLNQEVKKDTKKAVSSKLKKKVSRNE